MNITPHNPYANVSKYPVPVTGRTATARPADTAQDKRDASQARDLLSVEGRRSNREYSESSRHERSQAAAAADRIRGTLAPDGGLSVATQRALTAYQSIEIQDQREALTRTLGVDVYV